MLFSEIRKILAARRVGIAGAGGLGSNCAVALARCGIGTIVIADFDIVEAANLNRQYYFLNQVGRMKTEAIRMNILSIDPGIEVITYNVRIDRDNLSMLFEGCDVIVEAFDDADEKAMLVEAAQEFLPRIPLVIGSGMAGWGNNGLIHSRKIDEKLYICGDEESEVSDNYPALAPRVGIVANMQANTVLELLLGKSPEEG